MYVFRYDKLGDLGRIVVQGAPNGETKFTTELTGGPDDPLFKKRKAIFLPLSEKVMAFVEAQLGKKSRDEAAKKAGPATRHTLPTKLMTCSICDKPTALLIFANQWKDEGDLENAARVMYYEIRRLNVPTWVIGEISGEGNPMDNATIIKKVWPKREGMFKASPSEFNLRLEELDKKHCG